MWSSMLANWSLDTETQLQAAASPRWVCSGQPQRPRLDRACHDLNRYWTSPGRSVGRLLQISFRAVPHKRRLSDFIRCAWTSLRRGRGHRIVFDVGRHRFLLLPGWFQLRRHPHRTRWNLEHQVQQRNQPFAVGVQKAKVACPPETLGQNMLQQQPRSWELLRVAALSNHQRLSAAIDVLGSGLCCCAADKR